MSAECGNGVLEDGEDCDDGAVADGDGCGAGCGVEPGFECEGEPSNCRACEGEPGTRRCLIPGGPFERGPDDARVPATVSAFQLDELEVTVGRFRTFAENYAGPPAAGAGSHPDVVDSGFRADWSALLPATKQELAGELACHPSYATWTDEPGAREELPLTCATYYLAFAFCAAQGGRLPTEAEWEYAAAGGAQLRLYPWGHDAPNETLALFSSVALEPAGSRPAGVGRFGQLDLAGSVWEWTLDYFAPYPATCDRCAQVGGGTNRVIRGGDWLSQTDPLASWYRFERDPRVAAGNVGFRCAYSPEE